MSRFTVSALGAVTASLLGSVLATSGTPAQALPTPDSFTTSIQSIGDDTNLDEYLGDEVWTRDPSLAYQEWRVAGPSGDNSYLIRGTHFDECLTAPDDPGDAVTQTACDDGSRAQHWWFDPRADGYAIESVAHRDNVITANGEDTAATLLPDSAAPNQQWTLYQK